MKNLNKLMLIIFAALSFMPQLAFSMEQPSLTSELKEFEYIQGTDEFKSLTPAQKEYLLDIQGRTEFKEIDGKIYYKVGTSQVKMRDGTIEVRIIWKPISQIFNKSL